MYFIFQVATKSDMDVAAAGGGEEQDESDFQVTFGSFEDEGGDQEQGPSSWLPSASNIDAAESFETTSGLAPVSPVRGGGGGKANKGDKPIKALSKRGARKKRRGALAARRKGSSPQDL